MAHWADSAGVPRRSGRLLRGPGAAPDGHGRRPARRGSRSSPRSPSSACCCGSSSTDTERGRTQAVEPAWIGISNQTALPSWVGREPHRVASWSTRYSPRPPSSVSPALRIRGSRRSVSKTSTQTASSPRRSRRRELLAAAGAREPPRSGGTGVQRAQSARQSPGPGLSRRLQARTRAAGAATTAACSTTFVTTSDTSRQARSACSGSMPQLTERLPGPAAGPRTPGSARPGSCAPRRRGPPRRCGPRRWPCRRRCRRARPARRPAAMASTLAARPPGLDRLAASICSASASV